MFQHVFQGSLFHDLTRHWGEAAQSVVPRVPLLTIFRNGCNVSFSSHWWLYLAARAFQIWWSLYYGFYYGVYIMFILFGISNITQFMNDHFALTYDNTYVNTWKRPCKLLMLKNQIEASVKCEGTPLRDLRFVCFFVILICSFTCVLYYVTAQSFSIHRRLKSCTI